MKQKREEVFFLNAADGPKYIGNLRFFFCVSSSPISLWVFPSLVVGSLGNALSISLMMI